MTPSASAPPPTRSAVSRSSPRSTSLAPTRPRSPASASRVRLHLPTSPCCSARPTGWTVSASGSVAGVSADSARRGAQPLRLRLPGPSLRRHRLRVVPDLQGGQPVPPGDRRHHHRRQRGLPALHHAAQGRGAAAWTPRSCGSSASAGARSSARWCSRPRSSRSSDRCSAPALAFLAGAATNAYYRRFFDTELIFSLITPRIVLLQRRASRSLLGIAAGGCRRLAAGPHPADGALGPGVTGLGWGLKSLRRHPLRTALSLAGYRRRGGHAARHGDAERRDREVVQRAAARPRLSDPAHAQGHAAVRHRGLDPRRVRRRARRSAPSPASRPPAPCSAPRSTAGPGDSLVTLFGYGIQPEAQGIYQVTAGADLAPGDTLGVLLSETAARAAATPRIGDTVTLVGRLDPQIASASVDRRLVVRGLVRWIYDSPRSALRRHRPSGHAAARPGARPPIRARCSW